MTISDLKNNVFSHCDALETVTFNGESVIGENAFYDCPSLENVAFKKKTMLSEGAFGCTAEKPNSAMTELVLPGDSTIKGGAFWNYSKLNKVTIKKGAKLGTKILLGCSALKTFIFEADTPQKFESLTFTNFEPENITIYVPDVEKYKEALEQDTGSALYEHYNIEFVDCLKKLHIHKLTFVPAKDATCTEEGTRHIIFVTFAVSGLRMQKANPRLQIKQVLSYRQPVIRFQIGKLMITVTGMNVNVDTKRMLHNTVLNGW